MENILAINLFEFDSLIELGKWLIFYFRKNFV